MGPTDTEIAVAREALATLDPLFAQAHAELPPTAWMGRERGFAGMVSQIVGQQVSMASAAAIQARLVAGLGGELTPETVLAADEDLLRNFGLSGQKVKYVQAIAEAAELFDRIGELSDAEATIRLVAIKGVGRWTAETYLMFAENRLDLFPAGDLGLQEGYRLLAGSDARLSEKSLYQIAEAWSPYRTIAALMLWGIYTERRNRPSEASGRAG